MRSDVCAGKWLWTKLPLVIRFSFFFARTTQKVQFNGTNFLRNMSVVANGSFKKNLLQ